MLYFVTAVKMGGKPNFPDLDHFTESKESTPIHIYTTALYHTNNYLLFHKEMELTFRDSLAESRSHLSFCTQIKW